MQKKIQIPAYIVKLPRLSYNDTVSFLANMVFSKGMSPIYLHKGLIENVNKLHKRAGDIERDLQGHICAIKEKQSDRAFNKSIDFLGKIDLFEKDDNVYEQYSFSNLSHFFEDWFLAKELKCQVHDVDTDYLFDTMCQLNMAYAYDLIPLKRAEDITNWIKGQTAGEKFPIIFPIFKNFEPKVLSSIVKLSEWVELIAIRNEISRKQHNISSLQALWIKLKRKIKILEEYAKKHWANCGTLVSSAFMLQTGQPIAAIPLLFSTAKHFQDISQEPWTKIHWYPTLCFHKDPRYEDWSVPIDRCNHGTAFVNCKIHLEEKGDKMRVFNKFK